jgi:phosphatidate cytidylyltransferase
MNPVKHHDLGIRTLINGVSAVLVALFIFLVHYPPLQWMFAVAVALITVLAIWEYHGLIKKKGLSSAIYLSLITSAAYIVCVFFKLQGSLVGGAVWWKVAPEIVLALTILGSFVCCAYLGLAPITYVATTFFGLIYIAVPLGLMIQVLFFFRDSRLANPLLEGSWWLIYLIAVTKSADIGAYFIGRTFGRRRLSLKLSPKKTLEGALGGLIASISVSFGICYLGKHNQVFAEFSYLMALGMGVLIGIVGQLGDLAESFLKRDAGVKDSNTLPGVGGILDIIDSLLFTTPLVYIFLRISYT